MAADAQSLFAVRFDLSLFEIFGPCRDRGGCQCGNMTVAAVLQCLNFQGHMACWLCFSLTDTALNESNFKVLTEGLFEDL